MEITVLIEPLGGHGYRASSAFPNYHAEGSTREEALTRLQTLFRERADQGGVVVGLSVDNAGHPWDDQVGTWDEKDPVIQEWEKAVSDYRRQVDMDPNIP